MGTMGEGKRDVGVESPRARQADSGGDSSARERTESSLRGEDFQRLL